MPKFDEMTEDQKTLHRYDLVRAYVNHRGDKTEFNEVSYEAKTEKALVEHLQEYGPFSFYGHNIHLNAAGVIALD